jgi:hypothetical protein
MPTQFEPTYGLLTEVCLAFGIARTQAFAYARSGELDTFYMNGRRYVYLDSVKSLPERIGKKR